MPYFKDLTKLFEEVSLYADLRHEQNALITPILKRLESQLRVTKTQLQRSAPSKTIQTREPNDLAAIRHLRPKGPRRLVQSIPTQQLKPKLAGAWLARAAGCTLGSPVESWSIEEMTSLARIDAGPIPPADYWIHHPRPDLVRFKTCTVAHYLRDQIAYVPVDDDLSYTILGLLILEAHGTTFTTTDVARAWQKYLPLAWTAEAVTLNNLKAGIPAKRAAEKDNPYVEWIGADIRADPWAYAAPGWPERAAEFAYRDAILSHRYSGVYGAMFFAAAISAAFVVDDPIVALRVGLTEIPKQCRLAEDIRWALRAAPKLKSWQEARRAVDRRFTGMHHVHTNNNACLTVFALQLGQREVTKTIGNAVMMGLDNDCTAATAGSLLGAIVGQDGVAKHWWEPFRNKTRTYLNGEEWFSNTGIVNRFAAVARRTMGER